MTIDEIATEVRVYAEKYGCTLLTSLNDMEFDGPDGGSGLTDADYEAVAKKLGLWDEILRIKKENYDTAMEY